MDEGYVVKKYCFAVFDHNSYFDVLQHQYYHSKVLEKTLKRVISYLKYDDMCQFIVKFTMQNDDFQIAITPLVCRGTHKTNKSDFFRWV